MVKKISQLYLDARKALMIKEDPQTAGLMARNILCHFSGKPQEQIVADGEQYASEEVGAAVDCAVARLLAGEPLA